MKLMSSLKKYVPLLVIMLINPFIWGESKEKAAGSGQDGMGVQVLTRDQIVRSGARNLSDLLARLPGIRISVNSSQSQPSAGPLVSADTATQLSANQFSRVLILFNGHPLNKNWYGGANHEWGTGFLEGLKEIRVYTGPAAIARNGGAGAMDMIIDLIPFDGSDQDGSTDIRLTQSFNENRADKSLLHLRTGNRWGQNGNYMIFADVTRWGGADLLEGWGSLDPDNRMERKNPTFQLGTVIEKGPYDFMARHFQHYHFDPCGCGRKWTYTFAEGSRRFEFPARWDMKITGSADYIISRWGAGSSATGKAIDNWDKVTEFRLAFRTGLKRQFKTTSVFIGADFQYIWIDGGPELSTDYLSVMTFSTQRNISGASLRLLQRLFGSWQLQGAMRIEKVKGYGDVGFLPEISLLYNDGKTDFGLSFAKGHRYMDTWFRVGSSNYDPNNAVTLTPYIVPVELKPERNLQLKAWFQKEIMDSWVFYASAFTGKYSHLMGFDWDYAFETQFNQLRAMEVGNYSYWGGAGSLLYRGKNLSLGGNVSFQGVSGSDLIPRQLYVARDGNHPLYLPPVVANLFLDLDLFRRVSLSVHFSTAGSARNAGVDLTSAGFDTIFDTAPFENTPSHSNLNISLRLFDFWKKFEFQLSVHNALNDHVRLPIVGGGTFLSRGREITLTLRSKF